MLTASTTGSVAVWQSKRLPADSDAAKLSPMRPHDILATRNIVGEGILWDSRRELLWWTDIQGRKLHRYHWAAAELEILETPERIGSFGLVARSERLLTALGSCIGLYHVCAP